MDGRGVETNQPTNQVRQGARTKARTERCDVYLKESVYIPGL